MKLTIFLLTVGIMQVAANANSQTVSFSGTEVPLKKIFSAIKKQTGYLVVYSDATLDGSHAVTISASDIPLNDFLQKVLTGQHLEFSIRRKTIFIKKNAVVRPLRLKEYPENPVANPLKGSVLDENGTPLAGVSISVKGKPGKGTTTDGKGNFNIEAASGDVLLISSVGYLGLSVKITEITNNTITAEVLAADKQETWSENTTTDISPAANNKTSSMVVLAPGSGEAGNGMLQLSLIKKISSLNEVVVNMGYYSVRDKERTGSVSKITSQDIKQQNVINPVLAMQGRMAGVNIIQSSGNAGTGYKIEIRGRNSLRTDGNDPLYVIDGVPYGTQSMSDVNLSVAIISGANISPLNSMNPNDIESIEVLKDADATAIYGSRGSNGVVLITTRKGSKDKTTFSFQSNIALNGITKAMELMNTEQFLQLRRDAFKNDNIAIPANAYDVNGTWDQNRYTNWSKEFIGNQYGSQNHQFSVSGGSDQTRFLFSSGFRKDGTVYLGDFGYNKTNFMLNINHKTMDNRFEMQANVQRNFQNNKLMSYDFVSKVILAPNAPELYMENGELNWANNTMTNPLASLRAEYRNKSNDFVGQLSMQYKIKPNLTVAIKGGFTNTTLLEENISPSTQMNPVYQYTSEFSAYGRSEGKRSGWIAEPQLNWTKKSKKGKWDALIGATIEERQQHNFGTQSTNFLSNDFITTASNAKNVRITRDSEVLYHYLAAFGRLNYNHQGKYIFNITGRRDGSSRFGSNRRFANFGAVGAAWIFSEESFSSDYSWLSFGKLRASYGIAGNDLIGDYQYLNNLQIGTMEYDGLANLLPAQLYNPDFSWEKNKKFEVALELEFFNGRIAPSIAYYRNRSSNQLVGIPLPATTGFDKVQSNLDATVENTGFEFTLHTDNLYNKKIKWSTNFNISFPKNKLVEFPNLAQSTYAAQYEIGYPISIRKAYRYIGINKSTGLFEVEDINKDGYFDIHDRKVFINHNVTMFGGIQNRIQYKGISLDVFFQFVKQVKASPYYYTPLPGLSSNVAARYMDYFSDENPDAQYQKPTSGANSKAIVAHRLYYTSDAVSEDASFIRLKTVQLQYTFPERFMKKVRLSAHVQAQNLFTITNYWGDDPETTATYLPPIRTITFGFNLNF